MSSDFCYHECRDLFLSFCFLFPFLPPMGEPSICVEIGQANPALQPSASNSRHDSCNIPEHSWPQPPTRASSPKASTTILSDRSAVEALRNCETLLVAVPDLLHSTVETYHIHTMRDPFV